MKTLASKCLILLILIALLTAMIINGCTDIRNLDKSQKGTENGQIADGNNNASPDSSPTPSQLPADSIDLNEQNNGEGSQPGENGEPVETREPDGSEPGGTEPGENGESGETGNEGKKPELVKVKALYLTGWVAGTSSLLEHYVELAKTTEINAYVIDIKDDDGFVGYKSEIPDVNEIGGWMYKYDADKTLKTLKENGIRVIGRLVCFRDPVLSSKKPELAVKTLEGELWKDYQKCTWLDPYNKESWDYLIKIAKEAVEKGFDEIQFDYVRFPSDGDRKSMVFNENGQKKYEIINEFLAYAREQMPNVILSADIFGIVCESPEDTEDIGQYLEYIGENIDYISPMLYPSHYALGQVVNGIRFGIPDHEPYGVVYNTLVKALGRISKVEGYNVKIRPYLQDFTASWLGQGYYKKYGEEEVRQQIKAVEDAGLDEWILWDAENTYTEKALKEE